ncbi:MAG: dNTP triphosphohydrolase [Phycisphaerae bacterium]|nr:dNTP triphosphohydrolase [Phycisphaerae bacterium]
MTASAAYAVAESTSRGRRHPEPPHPYRGAFERDRDRIIHSAAFRRLEGKTQVFTVGLNDHYRTRLTHSIEVAQIGRTLARSLGVNESLTEAICLAHDLGHPPFGHTGESILNDLTAANGGFEHNRQTLRIVDYIEHPYPDFAGLNLMYETRLGLRKHSSPYDHPADEKDWPVNTTIEGQIADLADRIAYNCHDLEDGIRARLIEMDRLDGLELFVQISRQYRLEQIEDFVIRRTRLAKGMLDWLAINAIETSRRLIAAAQCQTWEQITALPETLVRLSEAADAALRQIEAFLMDQMYLHPELRDSARKAEQWLHQLYAALLNHPDRMPTYYQHMIPAEGLERTVCDYIAGMTDRFCVATARQFSTL